MTSRYAKCCVSCANSGKNNGRYGKTVSTETRALIGKANKGKLVGDNNPSKRPEVREKLSKLRTGANNTMAGKTVYDIWVEKYGIDKADELNLLKRINQSKSGKIYWESLTELDRIDRLKNHGNNLKSLLNNGGRYSKLHRKVKDDMDSIGLDFISEERMLNKYVVDEIDYKHKIVIEINGDYWHANPIKYSSGQTIKYPGRERLSDDVWKQDTDRLLEIQNAGFSTYVLWETDIKAGNHIQILNEIKKLYYGKD